MPASADLFVTEPRELVPGGWHYKGYFDDAAQADLLGEIRAIAARAPLFQPTMPRTGKPLSVQMTNCGPLGWVADRTGGYRYQPTHPVTGAPWPAMPTSLIALWRAVADTDAMAEAGLINFYRPGARMGLHRDQDEADLAAPVVSVSLGDDALFRVGGHARKDPTRSVRLCSGDVFVLSGPARLAFHGIDRLYPGTSALLREGGRINVTLRRVTRTDPAD